MKHQVKQFKSLAVALKEIEPFIRNGEHLQTGKRFKKFGGMLSREMVANWLLCVAISSKRDNELAFTTDPTGGDGVICDVATGEIWLTEHVLVPKIRVGQTCDAAALILKAIQKKCNKGGAAYASGKNLVVFLNAGAGRWNPNKVAQNLPESLHFATVWVVSLQGVEDDEYVYNVTHLDVSEGDAPSMLVRIRKDFNAWEVKPIQ
jgi:hypothetical protein